MAATAPNGTASSDWAVGEATSVDLAADGATMAVSTSTGAVRLIDVATGTPTDVLDRAQGDVSDVALAPDDTVVATGVSVQKRAEAWDDTIEATQLPSNATMFTLGGQSEDVAGCSFYEGRVDVLARRHAAGVQLARLHRAGHAARRPGRHEGPPAAPRHGVRRAASRPTGRAC